MISEQRVGTQEVLTLRQATFVSVFFQTRPCHAAEYGDRLVRDPDRPRNRYQDSKSCLDSRNRPRPLRRPYKLRLEIKLRLVSLALRRVCDGSCSVTGSHTRKPAYHCHVGTFGCAWQRSVLLNATIRCAKSFSLRVRGRGARVRTVATQAGSDEFRCGCPRSAQTHASSRAPGNPPMRIWRLLCRSRHAVVVHAGAG